MSECDFGVMCSSHIVVHIYFSFSFFYSFKLIIFCFYTVLVFLIIFSFIQFTCVKVGMERLIDNEPGDESLFTCVKAGMERLIDNEPASQMTSPCSPV